MAETMGGLVDKISIFNLKIFHMGKQIKRNDVNIKHVVECKQRLKIMTLQRNDLVNELNQFVKDIFSGKYQSKMYRQFKMYNDPKYRIKNKCFKNIRPEEIIDKISEFE